MIYINRILSPMYFPKRQSLYTSLVYITTWTTDVKVTNLWDISLILGLNLKRELKKSFFHLTTNVYQENNLIKVKPFGFE